MKTKLSPEAIIPLQTKQGVFFARYTSKGLAGLDFPGQRAKQTNAESLAEQVQHWHALTTTALEDVLAGRSPRTFPPLDVSSGTPFQQRVWNVLSRIKTGETMTYSEVAKAAGKPGAARAAGGACGANPIPVLIPCHRVLAANRKLGGFSAGLSWKRKLLTTEGQAFS